MTDTDDLLNEATRLADDSDHITADALRALVERVRAAEAEADKFRTLWDRHGKNDLIAERDSARAKLDTVRALAESMERPKVGGGTLSGSLNTADVLDILDGQDTK